MWEDKDIEKLVEVLASLQNPEETRAFLRDLMTDAELKEFSKRWKAARMLDKKIPYTVIEKVTGLSSATIARVSKWLQEGAGGYRQVLEKSVLVNENASQAVVTESVPSDSSDDRFHLP